MLKKPLTIEDLTCEDIEETLSNEDAWALFKERAKDAEKHGKSAVFLVDEEEKEGMSSLTLSCTPEKHVQLLAEAFSRAPFLGKLGPERTKALMQGMFDIICAQNGWGEEEQDTEEEDEDSRFSFDPSKRVLH